MHICVCVCARTRAILAASAQLLAAPRDADEAKAAEVVVVLHLTNCGAAFEFRSFPKRKPQTFGS